MAEPKGRTRGRVGRGRAVPQPKVLSRVGHVDGPLGSAPGQRPRRRMCEGPLPAEGRACGAAALAVDGAGWEGRACARAWMGAQTCWATQRKRRASWAGHAAARRASENAPPRAPRRLLGDLWRVHAGAAATAAVAGAGRRRAARGPLVRGPAGRHGLEPRRHGAEPRPRGNSGRAPARPTRSARLRRSRPGKGSANALGRWGMPGASRAVRGAADVRRLRSGEK
jgi:hypothetical protein